MWTAFGFLIDTTGGAAVRGGEEKGREGRGKDREKDIQRLKGEGESCAAPSAV